MEQERPEYLELHPNGLVRDLIDGGRVIYESNVINEWPEAVGDESLPGDLFSWMSSIAGLSSFKRSERAGPA